MSNVFFFCPAAVKTQLLILLQSPMSSAVALCLLCKGPEHSSEERWAGSEVSTCSWCGRGFCERVGCHIWGRPGWWKMAAVMMREGPVSGRQGQSPLLFLPPRSKCHLCESAATWPQGTLLPDAPLPPSWSKNQTPSWPLHLQWSLLGPLDGRGECRTQ